MTRIVYKSILKNLSKTIKMLEQTGYEVHKFDGLINSRKAYYINGELLTDYQIVHRFPLAYKIKQCEIAA